MKEPLNPVMFPRLFLKQYGMMRTGTNAVRASFAKNFDVPVLVNILGWKHGPWTDPSTYLEKHVVDNETIECQTSRRNREVWMEVRMGADLIDLKRAVEQGLIGYLISVKHPYALAYSTRKWGRDVPEMVRQFNTLYRGWMDNAKPFVVVRHESLVRNPAPTLRAVGLYFNVRTPPYPEPVDWETKPSEDWGLRLSHKRFNRKLYENREYEKHLSRHDRRTVEGGIDWGLAKVFGYRRDGGTDEMKHEENIA